MILSADGSWAEFESPHSFNQNLRENVRAQVHHGRIVLGISPLRGTSAHPQCEISKCRPSVDLPRGALEQRH